MGPELAQTFCLKLKTFRVKIMETDRIWKIIVLIYCHKLRQIDKWYRNVRLQEGGLSDQVGGVPSLHWISPPPVKHWLHSYLTVLFTVNTFPICAAFVTGPGSGHVGGPSRKTRFHWWLCKLIFPLSRGAFHKMKGNLVKTTFSQHMHSATITGNIEGQIL